MVDIHAHILPGVDDGARSLDEARAMLDEARSVGVRTIVATPHIYDIKTELFPARHAYATMQRMAESWGIAFHLGFEVNLHATTAGRMEYAPYAFAFSPDGPRYLLLELSNTTKMEDAAGAILEIVRQGLVPVLAHPERYAFVQADVYTLHELMRCGALMQVDAMAFLYSVFSPMRRTATKMLREKMITFVASDAHQPGDYARYAKVMRRLRDQIPQR